MSVSAAIRKMLDAGLTIEQALIAAEAFEGEAVPAERVLTKRQARNKRYYEKHKTSESSLNSDDQDASDASDVSDADPFPSSPEGSSPTPPSPKPLQSIPPSPPKGGSSPTDRAIETFSDQASKAGLPVPRRVTADRRRKIEARLREHGEDVWSEACRRMASSAFCRGENERGWRADLDFLCQPKSFNGLIEGKYDDRPRQQAQAPPKPRSDFMQRQHDIRQQLKRENGEPDDEFTGNTLDLAARDFRHH